MSDAAHGWVTDDASDPPPDGRAGITAELVARLLADQFPQWAGLPVRPVPHDGHDNRTYRLGDDLSVRLPTDQGYVAAIAKEDRWLPRLAPLLPLPVPQPVATGSPGRGYPHPWSIRRWLAGEPALLRPVEDVSRFAEELGAFLVALREVDPTDGPTAGRHSFHRGCPLAAYDAEVRAVLGRPSRHWDTVAVERVWEAGLTSAWPAPPVWFHGDVALGNLLVRDGRLAAVIDFGTCGVGDPACDFVLAWTFFGRRERDIFRRAVDVDGDTWQRARGWALWKALITDDTATVGAVLQDPAD